MTAIEAFVVGLIWGTLRRLPEGFEVDTPGVEGSPTLVVRGRKTGTEVLITITETRPAPATDAERVAAAMRARDSLGIPRP